ncbi:hypothetical protein VB638_14650 [Dolichospermum sp. UHCC 0684]|nr:MULTISPECIES: hypothetical protein [Dolichospermum]MDB9451060.1 hypothetical protein [Dolichospermum circinale CS-547]MEA5530797.1 hypothetical protein [Dolichospermum sp. UHCC 0684]
MTQPKTITVQERAENLELNGINVIGIEILNPSQKIRNFQS